jgi:hypothetical protein
MPRLGSMKSKTIYAALAFLFVLSLVIGFVPGGGSIARGVAAVPFTIAIVGAVFQLLRDHLAHDRAALLQVPQRDLAIGAASHMARIAFDKHVEFAESYVAETLETVNTLYRLGPGEEALSHAGKLYGVRRKSSLWLTRDIDAKLEHFEAALRAIGAGAHFIQVAQDHPKRAAVVDDVYRRFAEVMGMTTWEGS